ncbi:MAG TPA: hypothetical protein DD697_03675 [Candidatus Komeilibacteria bacterium]|nr:hypothetical protein [Candidatus Komeilibacteria bacterium]
MREAGLYKKLPRCLVQCCLCRHFCRLSENQRGLCGVRQNQAGLLVSLNYGRLIARAVDPVEKKPLFHFLPGTAAYSIAAVGCNLCCANCQNWQISQGINESKNPRPDFASGTRGVRQENNFLFPGDDVSVQEVVAEAVESGCRSIAYTYTEPTIFFEYALDCMKLARQHSLKNIWVSNGYMSKDCLNEILPWLDAINVDLKFFDEQIYWQNCGCHLAPILENLQRLAKAGVNLEVTTLLVPGQTDKLDQLGDIADFIATELSPDVPWHISKFSPEISYLLQSYQPTPAGLIDAAYEAGLKAGLSYVYTGNLLNDGRENTYCPCCRALVIRRRAYEITNYSLAGQCPKCGYQLPLKFE